MDLYASMIEVKFSTRT